LADDEEPQRVIPVAALPSPETVPAPVANERPSAMTGAPEPRWRIVDAVVDNDLDQQPAGVVAQPVSNTVTIAETPVRTAAATKPVSASATAAPKWEVLGQSAGNRPIHVRRAGVGQEITLIVAGLDGEDRIAVKWIDQLSQRIDEAPELVAHRQIVLLRAVNPDGLTLRRSANDRGVLINRNFPTAAYRAGGQPSSGTGPASESETRAVLQLLAELRPQRIIHVQSAHRTAALSNAQSPAALDSLKQALQAAPQAFEPRNVPGSLEDYAATVLGLEVVSLQLPTGDDWRSAGLSHVPTLLALSEPASARVVRENAEVAQKDPAADDSFTTSVFREVDEAEEAPTEPPRRGYEELPPPPFKPNW
jgi:hypothetical protein